jgi:exodeoxyribonuclease V beta subunit
VKNTLKEFSRFLNLDRAQVSAEKAQEMVLGMVKNIAECHLPQGFQLKEIERSCQLAELEFYLPAQNVSAQKLYELLLRHGVQIPKYQFEVLDGYLKGFIDLVFEHEGRWYVLDWKSNYLGDTPQQYAADSLQREMDKHGYVLQATLYSLALHRLLKQRLTDYAPNKHLGGAIYIFLRGYREEWRNAIHGETPGLWSFQPSDNLLNELDALFDGRSFNKVGKYA